MKRSALVLVIAAVFAVVSFGCGGGGGGKTPKDAVDGMMKAAKAKDWEKAISFMDIDGNAITRESQRVPWDPITAEKGGYKHFMLKEIHEQPRAVRDTLLGRVSLESSEIHFEEANLSDEQLRAVERICIVACGTSGTRRLWANSCSSAWRGYPWTSTTRRSFDIASH